MRRLGQAPVAGVTWCSWRDRLANHHHFLGLGRYQQSTACTLTLKQSCSGFM